MGGPAETSVLRDALLRDYGPFMTRKVGPLPIEPPAKRPRRSAVVGAYPLVDVDALACAAMADLRTAGRALQFVEWLSDKTRAEASSDSIVAADAIAARHGLRAPLFLPPGPPWVFSQDLLFEFERSERVAEGGAAVEAQRCEPKPKAKPVRRAKLSATVRNAVWNAWIGMEHGVGPCHCCARLVSQQDYECGHVVAAARGGSDHPDNLRPLCRACNRSMRDEHLYEFRRRVGFADGNGQADMDAA